MAATDQLLKARDYQPLIIRYRNGAAIRLSDVASVTDGVEDIRNAGLSDGGPLTAADCAARATAGGGVSLLCTLIPAEPISDAVGLDGEIDIAIVGDWALPSGSFWDTGPAGCMATNGGFGVTGVRPTGGNCGTAVTVKQAWGAPATTGTTVDNSTHERLFFTMSVTTPSNIPAGQRCFGYEFRYEPAFSQDAGGRCGTCNTPVCLHTVDQPGSFSGQPTTKLTTPTGLVGVTNDAFYNGGCAATPTKKRTWGLIKSLYR